MSIYWRKKYKELTEFIPLHPEINIGKSSIQIPKDIRPAFYQLFDAVRMTFLSEMFPDLVRDTNILVKEYIQVEKEVIKLLKLKSVSAPHNIYEFLHSPSEELIRGLFYILLDLLQEKIDLQIFENRASQEIKSSFNKLSQSGYEKWITLSLIKLLQADKLFQVNLRPFSSSELWKKGRKVIEEVPAPKASNSLQFNSYSIENAFTIPDAIIHSVTLNNFVSLRSEIGDSHIVASNASETMYWYPVDSVGTPEPSLCLIYLADKPEKISLVADAEKICRPDLIIECAEHKDWYLEERLEKIKFYHDKLKPTLGTYVVARHHVPDNVSLWQGIHILNVGLKQPRLEDLINAMLKHREKAFL